MDDVIIIGGGIVGAALAYELSQYQLRATVLEAENDVACGTTRANSAILHAGYDPKPGTLMAKLNTEGVRLAEIICRKLDVPYKRTGSLVLAMSEEELPRLEELYQHGKANGVPDIERISRDRALELEPNLNPEAYGALYAPTAAIVSPWEYALAMMEMAVKNGVALKLRSRVTGIQPTENGWEVQTASGRYLAKNVVNAAGVHCADIHNMALKPSYRILPNRGEYYLCDKSEGDRVSRVIFRCPTAVGKGVLVAPTVHGNLIVGPNAEEVSNPDDTATTPGGLAHVREQAVGSVPSLNLRENIRCFAGIRAASDREDFIIEQPEKGFIDLAGIKSPGLSAAPAIAKYAVGMLEENGLPMLKKDQIWDQRKKVRIRELPPEEQDRLIQKNPLYGRVICRCETITEGEILDAIHGPIPPCSVDGVKRRVNAGMGRCQGGFCGPRVVDILSRELGAPPYQICKDLDGSEILIGETKTGRWAE